MVTNPLTATAQVADTDEIRIQVMEEDLTATVERERLIAAARESAAPYRRGKGRVPGQADQPASPADRIETNP
jgi:hypothetical protein